MKVSKIIPFLMGAIIAIIPVATNVSAHGYVESSRAQLCKAGVNKDCGKIQYEPQSIEASKGFPEAGPADGKIASDGGLYPELDVQTADRWAKVPMTTGKNTISWTLTAQHSTDKWRYYITKPSWNPNKPITRADLELINTYVDGGAKPQRTVNHTIDIPADRKGYHVILGVWDIADTPNAFYLVTDVNITNGGPVQPDTEAPTAPTKVTATDVMPTSVSLNWAASTDNVGVHHYDLYRDGVKVNTTTTTSVKDVDLQPNTSYTYTVKAVDMAGNESVVSEKLVVKTTALPTVDTEAPTAPMNLHSMGETETSVSLMWKAATDNVGVHHYDIYRDGVKVGTTTGTDLVDVGLKASTTYKYTVKAVDFAGNVSVASNTLTVKTKDKTPTPEGTTWDSSKVYVGGDRVFYNGLEYKAKWWTQGNQPVSSDAWELVTTGVTAEWNSIVAYTGGQQVTFEGSTYEAKWWTKGEKPGTSSVWVKVK